LDIQDGVCVNGSLNGTGQQALRMQDRCEHCHNRQALDQPPVHLALFILTRVGITEGIGIST
jgi:hypothetical protein